MIFSVNHILQVGGILAVALIIFAESGLLIGFFLPGDTILIAAGVFAAEHKIDIFILYPAVLVAAILGYQLAYQIGLKGGPRIFKRRDGLLFRADYLPRTEAFMEKHGGKTMILARFIAVVRTIVPLLAGIGKMPKRTFLTYNLVGSFIWTASIVFGSFWIGSKFKHIDNYIVYVVLAGIILTGVTEVIVIARSKNSRRQVIEGLREEYRYFFKKTDA